MDPVTHVIPPEVIAHLREVAESTPNTQGWFTRQQYEKALGLKAEATRKRLRILLADGKLERRRFSLSDHEAEAMGMLGGAGVIMYKVLGEAA